MLRQDPEVAHLAGVYLKWMLLGLPAYAFNNVGRYCSPCSGSLIRLLLNHIGRRYFQSQGLIIEFTWLLKTLILLSGLFTVPARIVMVVAPINALLNYLLVWGPKPIRLGFIGAPIATALRNVALYSFNAVLN